MALKVHSPVLQYNAYRQVCAICKMKMIFKKIIGKFYYITEGSMEWARVQYLVAVYLKKKILSLQSKANKHAQLDNKPQ